MAKPSRNTTSPSSTQGFVEAAVDERRVELGGVDAEEVGERLKGLVDLAKCR